MTSLSSQLQSLRTATAQHQTVEKRHVSLLFAKKEAEALDRETVYKIGQFLPFGSILANTITLDVGLGCTGLQRLKELDPEFDTNNDLFDESRLHFQRTMITREENAVLNEKIEKLLFQLSPYLQHFACQQVLEWLIFKYQVYAYNAENMILTFLPFHETNIFGRLLSIIEYNFATSKDWAFLEEFGKKEYPVPFSAIVKHTASSTHSLITRITDHLNRGIQIAPLLLLKRPNCRSTLPSFRQASLMVICQLAISVKLTSDVVSSLTKVVLMKFRKGSLECSLSTLIVLCQQQTVESLSNKAVLKTLRSELEVWSTLKTFTERTDLTAVLKPLWSTLFTIASEESYESDHAECIRALMETSAPETLVGKQATIFFNKLLEHPEVPTLHENASFSKHVYSMVARFSDQWMDICTEWTSRDEKVLASVVQHYHLEPLMVVQQQTEVKKKRSRRRSNSIRKSLSEDPSASKPEKKDPVERAQEMASTSEFARRQEFAGDPMKKALEWIKKEKWDKVAWAFDEMASRKSYFADKADDDIETFVLEIILLAITGSKCPIIEKAHAALSEANLRSSFVLELLSRSEPGGPTPKKSRQIKASEIHDKVLKNETKEEYEKRLKFVLELLATRTNPTVDGRLFHTLFDILKDSCDGNDALTLRVVTLLLKMLKYPGRSNLILLIEILSLPTELIGKYKITDADLKMNFVVDIMRATHSHHILRESLRLLTAAVRLSPSSVASHVMSVFTFMGSGLFRKDNELTLGIIEDTIEALFRAVCEEDGKSLPNEMRLRLVSVARILAVSTCDIPAHRRARMAHAITRAFSAAVDIVNFVVRLGGDEQPKSQEGSLDQAVFDRSKYSLPKLRHFRFVVMGLVVRVLSNRKLFEKLGELDDEVLYQAMTPVGKRLMTSSVELDEFIASERAKAVEAEEQQTLRNWIALSGRAETVSEKMRHLMPGGVAARIITDLLEDEKTEWRMREKALQLANSKLIHDGFFFTEGGINVHHLERMAAVLNKWIVKERSSSEEVVLCQNAAFSLKLVAKRLGTHSDVSVLSDTMAKCIDIAADYQTLDECLVGNILLLSGELIRSQNMKATMISAVPLLKTCLSILSDCISGEKISALTCVQRIMDQFAPFISQFLPEILVHYCRLTGRYSESPDDSVPAAVPLPDKSQFMQNPKGSIRHRLDLIRTALLKIEMRVIPEHFAKAVVQLISEEKSLVALFTLLACYFDQKNRVAITQNRNALLANVFLQGLAFRSNERNVENFASIENVERSVFKSLLTMAEVLTENTLRSVMNGLVDWAEQGLKPSATKGERSRLVTVFSFANSFYDSFNTLALPYFGRLVEISSKVLQGCNATIITDSSLLLLHGKKETIDGLEADSLVVHVLDFVNNCARHREFLTQERAEALIEPLTNEVVNSKLCGHEKRCVPHLADALYHIADAHPDVFQEILEKLLLKTRSNRAKIRYRALLVVEAIFDKAGDGIAPHLPMVMPFLSELLEDENRNVEEQCDRVVRLLQSKFGENICEGFM
ncbi:unnamed protein product [Heligmosomoides polygyrus]|uniref:HEAT repeat-containing protein 1 n=1 Tax=Heligmosomoides polygyrus TaxID=6339 RepID=A0A183FXR1_HELPZ|nr:unnamed protein product [Heligmosomoides polygyrus]